MRATALHQITPRRLPLSDAEKAIIRTGLEAGLTYEAIHADLRAKGYNRGINPIRRFGFALVGGRGGKPWTSEDIEILRARCAAGVLHRDIGEELGRPTGSIQDKASDLGFLQRRKWSSTDRERLIAGHARNERLADIADAIGRPYSHVCAEAGRLRLKFRVPRSPLTSSPPCRTGGAA